MTREKILQRIEKCLALAGNNPSEAEAQAALAAARRLMAEHNVSEAEVGNGSTNNKEIVDRVADVKVGTGWKRNLAALVADYFKCKHFYYNLGRGTYKCAFLVLKMMLM